MNPTLPEVAVEFGAAAAKVFDHLGGVDCARRAELQPDVRGAEIEPALKELGTDDLDPRADLDAAAAAAELCRRAGRVGLPYPLVGALLRDGDGRFATLGSRTDHGDLCPTWRVVDLEGGSKEARAGARLASKLGPFVTDLTAGAGLDPSTSLEVALLLTLPCWRVLGTVERALELAVEHVRDRVQFGQALAEFQAVQFQLADAAVGVEGQRELARFTLWRTFVDPDGALVDALALRLHALDSARAVLRTSQQLHGAAGLCDEYDVSVLARHIQPDLRLPFGAERTAEELFAATARLGFDSLFPQGDTRP